MKIIVDTREQNPWSFFDDEVISMKLDEGDYTAADLLEYEHETGEKTVRIERKASTGELAVNLGSKWKTFERELKRLSVYEQPILMLEFSEYILNQFPKYSGIPKNMKSKVRMNAGFMRKRLHQIRDDYGIEVIFCHDRHEAAEKAKEILENAIEEKIKR